MSERHLSDTISDLKEEGYTQSFRFTDGKLIDNDTGATYAADDITGLEEHRFEGMSNPDDMSLLFALELSDNKKGTITAAYGPQGNTGLIAFMNEVEQK